MVRLVPAVICGHDHREVALAERLFGMRDELAERTIGFEDGQAVFEASSIHRDDLLRQDR